MTHDHSHPPSTKPERPRAVRALAPLMSVLEVAAVLGVPKSCVYYLVKAHGLPVRKIGKYFRFYERELLNWIDEHKENDR